MNLAEIQPYVTLLKDALLALAAFVTSGVAIFGARAWKREHVGKERFEAAKNLVVASNELIRAARRLRSPIWPDEEITWTDEEMAKVRENRRWRFSQATLFQKRVDAFVIHLDKFHAEKLKARVLIGSSVLEAFIPFHRSVSKVVLLVTDHITLMRDLSEPVSADAPKVVGFFNRLNPSVNGDDDLSQELDETREAGELFLLRFLHRGSISR
jgi:hypothetical protein